MLQKIQNWLAKIQDSNEAVKRKYLIGATIITMVIIMGLWLGYLKLSSQSLNPAASQPDTNQESGIQFWQVFKNGLNVVADSIKQNFQNLFSQIYKGNTIDIK